MFHFFLVNYVIGIPTAPRENGSYIIKTLRSLIKNTTPDEKKEILIVLFIATSDITYQNKVKKDLEENFPEETKNGFINILRYNSAYYPKLDNLPRTYGDDEERVKWRSKLCLDFSYIFYYCSDAGKYYISLEDDVIAKPNYLRKIKRRLFLMIGSFYNGL